MLRRPHFAAATVALAITCLAATALAENHFLLELDGGTSTPTAADDSRTGISYGGTFGFGGRIPGSTPAYYFVGRIGAADYETRGALSYGRPSLETEQREWALGARMYVPITERFRGMLQLSLGHTHDCTTVHHAGQRPLLVEEDLFSVFATAGLQYRFTNHFSLGALADIAWHPDNDALAARSAGIETDGEIGRMRLAVTTTFHF
jgi:hypothetical protein